jgi:ketosteroid isomerase-like protein
MIRAADTSSTAAPWYGARTSKADIADFFRRHGETMTVDHFEPATVIGGGDKVLAFIKFKAHKTDGGGALDMNPHHYFRFRDGKISYYRGSEDTAQTVALFRD